MGERDNSSGKIIDKRELFKEKQARTELGNVLRSEKEERKQEAEEAIEFMKDKSPSELAKILISGGIENIVFGDALRILGQKKQEELDRIREKIAQTAPEMVKAFQNIKDLIKIIYQSGTVRKQAKDDWEMLNKEYINIRPSGKGAHEVGKLPEFESLNQLTEMVLRGEITETDIAATLADTEGEERERIKGTLAGLAEDMMREFGQIRSVLKDTKKKKGILTEDEAVAEAWKELKNKFNI